MPIGCVGQCMNGFAKEKEEMKSKKVITPDWFTVNLVQIKCFFNNTNNQILQIV